MDISHEQKCLGILLKALESYKDGEAPYEEWDIIDEQIGALRANLYGEEYGWRIPEDECKARTIENCLNCYYLVANSFGCYCDYLKKDCPFPLICENWKHN